MWIGKTPSIKSHEITDEQIYRNRRHFIRDLACLGALGVASRFVPKASAAETTLDYMKNEGYSLKTPMTSYGDITSYNNFYEFSTDKREVKSRSQSLVTRPWTVEVAGEVNYPKTFDIDELLKLFPLEERIYRFRCVETWAMVVPWIGFPLSALLKRCQPTGQAQFVEFTTLVDPKQMPNQKPGSNILDWPYTEALRMDEAMHPLTLMTVGLYGRSMPPQNGAPIRLIVPWKYGFKSCKSVVRIRVTRGQPRTTWSAAIPQEYGFYANVNPKVRHPRWSQAREWRLGEGKQRKYKTLPFNGYADEVAKMYKGMNLRKYF